MVRHKVRFTMKGDVAALFRTHVRFLRRVQLLMPPKVSLLCENKRGEGERG